MNPNIWIIASFIGIFFIIYISGQRTKKLLQQQQIMPDIDMPRTHLEKLARKAIGIILIISFAAFMAIKSYGVQVWWEDDVIRGVVTALLLSAIMIYFLFDLRVQKLRQLDNSPIDERDELILNRACAPVGGSMMVLLAVWMIALTESFQETGLVPTYYLYLIFWSVVIGNVLASLAGILIAYKKPL